MGATNKHFKKRLSIFGLAVIVMLCVAMLLQAPHVGTLLNTRVVSQDFGDIVEQTTQKEASTKDTRADGIKLPTSWWDDGEGIASNFDGGTGTVSDPYQIATPEQLALMHNKINNEGGPYLAASYQLVADIDMRDRFWSPMGTWAGAFRGTFDGGTHRVDADGVDRGTVHTISGLIMKNRETVDNGSLVGFFGVLGDQAVITNVIIDNSIAYLDPEIELNKDSLHATLAVVASQVKNDARVLFQNMLVTNSATFIPQTYYQDSDEGVDFVHAAIKSGIYVGWQQGDGNSTIYMNEAHVRMSSVLINIYMDLSGWDMSPDTVINSFGGLIGEASRVDIQNSSFEGIVGVEVVRRDRNMDNARLIYNAGGAIGTLNSRDNTSSYMENLDLSGSIYLDTFKNEEDGWSNRSVATAQSSKAERDIPWAADVRQIGGIIGDANSGGNGRLDIYDVATSFYVDAPKGDNVNLGDKPDQQSKILSSNIQTQSTQVNNSEIQSNSTQTKSTTLADTQIKSTSSVSDLSDSKASIGTNGFSPAQQEALDQAAQKGKVYAEQNKTLTSQHLSVAHTDKYSQDKNSRELEGPPTAPSGPIVFSTAGPALVFMMSYLAYLAVGLAYWYYLIGLFTTLGLLIIAVIIIIAVVVFAILFAFWGAMKPKWESTVYVGSAIGSEGRKGIILNNVHTANTVVASDTMFSKNDGDATISESHQTTPTMGMIVSQPSSPNVQNIGDQVSLSVSGKGTVMNDGKLGVDSVLEYQWYYNTIDSNRILDGSEQGWGGAKTVEVEGATQASLELNVDWVGSRYYFAKQINHVIEFRGNINSVTARVGNKKVSVKPAEIIEQPQSVSTNVNTAGKILSVTATATGDIDYQWYYSTTPSTVGSILLSGGNKSEFVPLQSVSGTYYYYVVVTVSISVSGTDQTLRADTISDFAIVDIKAIANDISISVQPEPKKTVEFNMNTIIGIQVDLGSVNGTLSYQWYKTTGVGVETSDSSVELVGETRQSLLVDTSVADTTSYYYVIATNTVESSSKSIKSKLSEITVSSTQALKINLQQTLESATGVAGETPIALKVFATAEAGGSLKYQWFKTGSSTNTNGTPVPGGDKPILYILENNASLDYYYAELYTTTPDGTISKRQRTDVVSVEFVDYNEYYFEKNKDIIDSATIVRTQSVDTNQENLISNKTNNISNNNVQAKTTDNVLDQTKVILNASLDTSSIVGQLYYQWYVSDTEDIADAIPIEGAVSNFLMIDTAIGNGSKFYFVNITNSVQVYSISASISSNTDVYKTLSYSKTVGPVAIGHTEKPKHNVLGTILTITISVATIISLAAGLTLVLRRRSEPNYYDRMYD